MGQWIWLKFLFTTALRNLWRSPRRTIISLTAIGASTASLILFQSFVSGVEGTFRQNIITSRYGHFQIIPKGNKALRGDEPLDNLIQETDSVRKAIETEVGPLVMAARQLGFFGLLTFGEHSSGGYGMGVDAEEEVKFLTMTQVVEGKHLAGSPDDSVFVGVDFAQRMSIHVGDTVTIVVTTNKGSINAMDLTVVGTFRTGITDLDERFFFVHHPMAEGLLRIKGAQRLILGFNAENELPYQAPLKKLIEEKFPKMEVLHWPELAGYFNNTMGWLRGIFNVFRVIILLIATLSIINVFTITLLERTGEFGTLRAIGTSRSEITLMIFVEAILQAVIGGTVGVLGGILVIELFLRQGVMMPPPLLMSTPFHVAFHIPWRGVAESFALCVLVAGGSGVFPAIKISRINIVQALGRNV